MGPNISTYPKHWEKFTNKRKFINKIERSVTEGISDFWGAVKSTDLPGSGRDWSSFADLALATTAREGVSKWLEGDVGVRLLESDFLPRGKLLLRS